MKLADANFDVIYLYSVFTHMQQADVEAYLDQFAELLTDRGRLFVTFFAEDGVADFAVNPAGYGPFAWKGPLHCVRFSNARVEVMVSARGFEVERIERGINSDGQSGWYLRRK